MTRIDQIRLPWSSVQPPSRFTIRENPWSLVVVQVGRCVRVPPAWRAEHVYTCTATWPLTPGAYEIRFLVDDSYRSIAATANFKMVKQ